MGSETALTVRARWDSALVPAGTSSHRNLLLEITAPPRAERGALRPAINLALVIDRSGSMARGRIQAAKTAASCIAEALTEADRLSLVIFDNEVEVLLDGCVMDRTGRREALAAIAGIQTRGATNLSAGWFEGARCVAGVLEQAGQSEGHVMVLSDGRANQGLVDPEALAGHASELADRGVKTSAIGIGAGYSPLQLDALAEGGRGRLHDSETSEDIIDVVLGELGELQAITARDVYLSLGHPPGLELDVLTRATVASAEGALTVSLGDIVADATRPLAVRVRVPAFPEGSVLPFELSINWRDAANGTEGKTVALKTRLQVVPVERAEASSLDRTVVECVADLWEAILVYRAMGLNERGEYAQARDLYVDQADEFSVFMADLPDSDERVDRLQTAQQRVSSEWGGRSKRQAYALSKKRLRMEQDHRRKAPGDWHEHLK